jgi:hypothetical protein
LLDLFEDVVAGLNKDIVLLVASDPLLEGVAIVPLGKAISYHSCVFMHFKDHLLEGSRCNRDNDDTIVVVLSLGNGKTQDIHLLFDIFEIFAGCACQL